jgi:hypothetical protein
MKIKKIEIGLRARFTPQREAILKHIKSKFFRDVITQLLLIPSIFLLLAAWVLAIYYFRASEYLVPLRYNSFVGVYSLGNWYDAYIIPVVTTTSFVANVLLGKTIYQKDKFLGYILLATNIFLAIVGIVVIINFGKINTL